MNKLTILFQIDALRYDYVDKHQPPFLSQLAEDGVTGNLVPTFGFEPDAAYTAGLFPDQCDGGAQFWFDSRNSPFKVFRHFQDTGFAAPRVVDKITRKLFLKAIRAYCKAPTLSLAGVPYHMLSNFSFPMQYEMDHPKFCATDSIYDLLRNEQKEWLFHCNPGHKVDISDVVKRAKEDLHEPKQFAFFLIGNLDRIGHKYGPNSPELSNELSIVDRGIKEVVNCALSRFDEVSLVIIGDHGMVEVTKTLDIKGIFKGLKSKFGKDYIYFLDSTMVRFKIFTQEARNEIKEALLDVKDGHMLDEDEIGRYHLNYGHTKFGDIIFVVDPGVLVFPSYYDTRTPVKGMHGYLPENTEQQSYFLLNSPKIETPEKISTPVDMRRIFPTVLKMLELKHTYADSKSIV